MGVHFRSVLPLVKNMTTVTNSEHQQEHSIKLYLLVWFWLFVLSTCSYLVDYFDLHGYMRWSLIFCS